METPLGQLVIEVQSVNRKYLEISVSTPELLSRYEHQVRAWVAEALSRGQVSVRISFTPKEGQLALADISRLKKAKNEWVKIAKQLGTDPQEITLSFLMQYMPQQSASDAKIADVQSCLSHALKDLLQMKQKEGKALAKDLAHRLKLLEKGISAIEKLSPETTQKMRQRLIDKMQEVLQPGAELEERLLREVALFAERVDIAEEITRFHSHIAQFQALLGQEVVGRKMDFLIQEMGREINTIGSKAMQASISHLVVNLKSELEKMREQIQNIE